MVTARGCGSNEAVEVSAATGSMSDRDLWNLSADGDQDAFAEMFHRHAQRVWNQAYRLCGSWDQAEDLSAATFLLAWRRRGAVALVNDSALPWLLAVVSNLARDEMRGLRRRDKLLRRIPPPTPIDDPAEAVVVRLSDRSEGGDLRRALAALPEAQRRAVELCLVAELSTADAAAALGISEATIRSNLSRGRARLRDALTTLRARQEKTR
ncbi:RNA polymerase sigma factor [Pseudonocardia ailaonensis]|uniref:RNA polymerase sigma factor n=1 Tax=Pseudonocardia ailaonensis TaxID=367279 RepID=A0ABN2N4A3_9PSEU